MKDKFTINTAVLQEVDDTKRELYASKLIVEAHDWLNAVGDDTPVAEVSNARACIADVVKVIKNHNLDRDLLLDATMVLRLAERTVGKAVRRGQATGEIGSLGTNNPEHRGGREKPPSPTLYIGSGNTAYSIYTMADGVTDEQFSTVLKEARSERRLDRAHIVRRITEMKTGKKKPDFRRDLVDQSREAAEQLRKVTVKLRNLHGDDRLLRNKAEVAARMRPYLDAAVAVCTDLKKTLDES